MNIHLIVLAILILLSTVISYNVRIWDTFYNDGMKIEVPQMFLEKRNLYKGIDRLFVLSVPLYDIFFYYDSPILLLIIYMSWLLILVPWFADNTHRNKFKQICEEMEWDFEEKFVAPVVQTETNSIGAYYFEERKRKFRTVNFIGESP